MRTLQAQESDKQAAALTELNAVLRKLAEKVKGPYFLGDAFSLVDVAVAPWVMRDYVLTENRGYAREAVGAGWAEYARNLENRESVRKTHSVSDTA